MKKRARLMSLTNRSQLHNRRSLFWLLLGLLLMSATAVLAQDDPLPSQTVEQLFITDSSAQSAPNIELRLYGRNANGESIDFAQAPLTIQSNGTPVGPFAVRGTETVGTFTVFLIDIPPGVSGQIPTVQDAIQQFASPGGMVEQVDSVAVYQIGTAGGRELLAPTSFHNSVRNLFVTPIAPELGATALYDSAVSLMEQIEALKPDPAMAASIVLMTDGTDAVSTQNDADDVVETAVSLGIPMHTIWLLNENLDGGAQSFGQEYLTELASATGGIEVDLITSQNLPQIWNRIGSFRDQTLIQYTATALAAGEFDVTVSLTNNSNVSATTAVSIPPNLPSIVIDLPAEARALTLPTLDRPVDLRFNTRVSWLDGEVRDLEAAQLVVNGAVTADIVVDDVEQFTAEVDTLVYGNNSIEVVVLDSQGILARSPEIVLTVSEGPRRIPSELSGGPAISGAVGRGLLVAAIVLIPLLVWLFAWRNGWLAGLGGLSMPRGRRRGGRRVPQVIIEEEDVSYNVSVSPNVASQPLGYLDVLETKSTVPATFTLKHATVKIGRSPEQTDITFDQDITLSRLHATLRLEGQHYRIYDEQSTSGTWVNEQAVPDYGVQLRHGDEIHMGAVHLRYRES